MFCTYPRLMIAGLGGDSGKTLLSLGLLKLWRRLGIPTAVFKKGPDYIDAAWLYWASGSKTRNLDTFLIEKRDILKSFLDHGLPDSINLIEGNRGLYDGADVYGTHSSAELAKLLDTPVILVINVKKVTRTVAAMVLGCQKMDPDVNIAGVVLNRVANTRQKRVITEAIHETCGLPVLGAIPPLNSFELLPGRHLGLITPAEHTRFKALESQLHNIINDHVDTKKLDQIARSANSMNREEDQIHPIKRNHRDPVVKIGVFQDSAFTFYYPENLEQIERCGAKLVNISPLHDTQLPEIDALYIGGGFPETHAHVLSQNSSMLSSVKERTEQGLPVYAECGGLIYLAESLRWNGVKFPMSGALPIAVQMESKPQGHGYCQLKVVRKNPFFAINRKMHGHEFHYSKIIEGNESVDYALALDRGTGSHNKQDGIIFNNILASYVHLHALGIPEWGSALMNAALQFRKTKLYREAQVSFSP